MTEKTKNNPAPTNKKAIKKEAAERRLQIFAILLIVLGILVALSIFFYSSGDEVLLEHVALLDVLRIPFDAAVKSLAAQIQNSLGLLGAIVANFFINSTIGYSSIIVAVLCVVWGWFILRKKEVGKLASFTTLPYLRPKF